MAKNIVDTKLPYQQKYTLLSGDSFMCNAIATMDIFVFTDGKIDPQLQGVIAYFEGENERLRQRVRELEHAQDQTLQLQADDMAEAILKALREKF